MWIYFNILFIPVIKAEFSASFLQSWESYDPSEFILICWFAAQETFLIINHVENSCAVETVTFLRIKCSKEQHLFETEISNYKCLSCYIWTI